jgi:hypothetical protein
MRGILDKLVSYILFQLLDENKKNDKNIFKLKRNI